VLAFLRCASRPLLLALALGVTATGAWAQIGSIMPPSKATPPETDPRNRRPGVPDYRQYEYGKEIFAVKLGCRSCPLGDKPLDESVAKRFFVDEELRATLGLEEKEEEAVSVYLRQRFGLML
jgi:hypothetical protein